MTVVRFKTAPSAPIRLRFDLPFQEAIDSVRARGVVVPEVYYDEAQAAMRRSAFTVSSLAEVSQIEDVRRSLASALGGGQGFEEWKKQALKKDWGLTEARLETVFRTNVQTAYSQGHWRDFAENAGLHPFLMYSSINDGRTRPAHKKMNGYIAHVTDSIWRKWTPPCGYNCRCSQIALTEQEALARGLGKTPRPVVEPDAGFGDADPRDLLNENLQKALQQKAIDLPETLAKTLRTKADPPPVKDVITRREATQNQDLLPLPTKARTIAEAERWAKTVVNSNGAGSYPASPLDGGAIVRFRHPGARATADVRVKKFGKAKLTGMTVDAANEVNRWLYHVANEADAMGIPRLRGLNTAAGRNGATMGDGVLAIHKNNGRWVGKPASSWRIGDNLLDRPRLASGFFDQARQIEQTMWHEFGHHIHQTYGVTTAAEYHAPPLEKALNRLFVARGPARVAPTIYSSYKPAEWFAESFSLYKMGRSDLVDSELVKLIEKVYRGSKDLLP